MFVMGCEDIVIIKHAMQCIPFRQTCGNVWCWLQTTRSGTDRMSFECSVLCVDMATSLRFYCTPLLMRLHVCWSHKLPLFHPRQDQNVPGTRDEHALQVGGPGNWQGDAVPWHESSKTPRPYLISLAMPCVTSHRKLTNTSINAPALGRSFLHRRGCRKISSVEATAHPGLQWSKMACLRAPLTLSPNR